MQPIGHLLLQPCQTDARAVRHDNIGRAEPLRARRLGPQDLLICDARAEGAGADRLARDLAAAPGGIMAAPFGSALHVSGTDRAALEAAIAPYRRPPFVWTEVRPTLEDVFIRLMGQASDNVQ